MAKIAVLLNLNPESAVTMLTEAAGKLDNIDGELVLDLSSLPRIDSNSVGALDRLAAIAEQKAVKVILRGANIEVYKTLKLINLTPRFAFVN